MKNSDKKSVFASLTDKFHFYFDGFLALFSGREKDFFQDYSHMMQKEEGSKMHFFYGIFFTLCAAAALWQHSTVNFTFSVLLLTVPAAFILFIPYKIADILLRQLMGAGIFFCACFWITYRLKHAIAFDLALVEGLIAGAFAFFFSCTKKDYHYLFFAGGFLLVYAGLVPRKLLLYLAPCIFFCISVILAGERKESLAGGKTLKKTLDYSYLRSFFRSWHILLLQALLAIPVFIYVFSLIPLHETGHEGFFEVSFMTSRTSALPPDLQKWLKQDKKVTVHKKGVFSVKGEKNAELSSRSGKKDLSGDLPGNADGNGKGSSPGKDLLFTVSMPVKLYHLATLYDEYDGKKWHTTSALLKNHIREPHRNVKIYPFTVSSKYTIHKWISPNLYAPYRFLDIQANFGANVSDFFASRWNGILRNLDQNSFRAKFSSMEKLPGVPFQYTVNSSLAIPVQSTGEEKKETAEGSAETAKKNPVLFDSAEDIFSFQTEKEKENRLLAMKKAGEAKEKQKKNPLSKKKTAPSSAGSSSPAKPVVLRFAPAIRQTPIVTGLKYSFKPVKVIAKDSCRLARPRVLQYAPERPVINPYYRKRHDPAWLESLPKKHFLRLPEDLSTRVTGLAGKITKGLHTPYEKAIALRDHLRNNYTYKLYAEKVPEGKESIEYFLFELKEGHCEYFASALTVLARSCGLPARVAVGFSPGNYNALTKLFEVHEYHAHAWSQIYIDQVGWLTFDAVPPGNIISDTLPAGLGLLRDPFGQDWKVTPPELADTTLGFVKNSLMKEALKFKSEQIQETVSKIIKNDDALKSRKAIKNSRKAKAAKKKKVPASGTLQRMKSFFLFFTGKSGEKFLTLLSTTKGRTFLIVLCIFLGALFFFFRDILAWGRLVFYRYKFGKILTRTADTGYGSAEKDLLFLYRALRLLLQLSGMARRNNQELLAYGRDTEKYYFEAWEKKNAPSGDSSALFREKSVLFSAHIRHVFTGFYLLEYGQESFSSDDIKQYRKEITEVFFLLRALYPDGFFFLEKLIFAPPFQDEETK